MGLSVPVGLGAWSPLSARPRANGLVRSDSGPRTSACTDIAPLACTTGASGKSVQSSSPAQRIVLEHAGSRVKSPTTNDLRLLPRPLFGTGCSKSSLPSGGFVPPLSRLRKKGGCARAFSRARSGAAGSRADLRQSAFGGLLRTARAGGGAHIGAVASSVRSRTRLYAALVKAKIHPTFARPR